MEADRRLRRAMESRVSSSFGMPMQPTTTINNYMMRDKWDVVLRLPADLSQNGPLQDLNGGFYFMMGYSAMGGPDILK